MEDLSESLHISQLIVKSLGKQLTEAEKRELEEWLSNTENDRLYQSLQGATPEVRKEKLRRLHPEKAWKGLEERIRFTTKFPLLRFVRYAAILAFLLATGTFVYLYPGSVKSRTIEFCEQKSPQPGSSKALLILESGQEVELKTDQDFMLKQDSTVMLNNAGNTLQVKLLQKQTDTSESFQTLVIPRGGEYKLILSDGSTIWLNSETRLRFPSSFSGEKRRVYLEGEAYFEVSHNSSRPFIVSVKEMEVEVLGTKFNIKAYEEDAIIYTTLSEGSVKATYSSTAKSLLLQPNQQARYTKQNGHLEKQETDARLSTGWTEGRFVFENETLDEIMKQLGRWYNTEVVYQSPQIKKYRFTGDVDRFDNISTILQLIEKTYNITFTTNGNTIIVGKR